MIAAATTALYLNSTRQGADPSCFTNLTLVDGNLHSGSSELIFSGEAGLLKVMIENDAPNQLMGFFSQPGDGPAEVNPDLIGAAFSVCKTNGALVVSQ